MNNLEIVRTKIDEKADEWMEFVAGIRSWLGQKLEFETVESLKVHAFERILEMQNEITEIDAEFDLCDNSDSELYKLHSIMVESFLGCLESIENAFEFQNTLQE